MKWLLLFLVITFMLPKTVSAGFWEFQSIDTMKYSRDLSREKLNDKSFDSVIDSQIGNIANTGATHVAIGTPYDEEFLPYLKRWVNAARKHNLKIWFRGNWSGWEGWFDYPKINREQHSVKTRNFILSNKDLFRDGDIFSPCPECENGGPGDPRQTGDVSGHRQFLISQHRLTHDAFEQINVEVKNNYNSMNGDVAKLIMDRGTTQALGRLVVVDHYVKSPEQLATDIAFLASRSGGDVVLGEFGTPIPDIHGNQTQQQQSDWINESLQRLAAIPEFKGFNYWTSVGGSSHLWSETGQPRLAVGVIKRYFSPSQVQVNVKNTINQPLLGAQGIYLSRTFSADSGGQILLPLIPPHDSFVVTAPGYEQQGVKLGLNETQVDLILAPETENFWYSLRLLLYRIFGGNIN